MTISTCIHGHPWTKENTYFYLDGTNHVRRRCRICTKKFANLRYRNDPIYQEEAKTRARDRYYSIKAANEQIPSSLRASKGKASNRPQSQTR